MAPLIMAILNPTSVIAHLAELKAVPADLLPLAERAMTRGGQRYAAAEL